MPFAGNLIFGLAIDTYIMSHDLIKMSYNLIVTKVNKKSSKYKITILDIWNRSQNKIFIFWIESVKKEYMFQQNIYIYFTTKHIVFVL